MKSIVIVLSLFLSFAMPSEMAMTQARDSNPKTCNEIKNALEDSLKIKSGLTRQDVEKLFEQEGGLNTRGQTRYEYKKCTYVHLEIYFKLAPPRNSLNFLPADTVVRVSKPYLAYATID